jgi:trehalase-like protein
MVRGGGGLWFSRRVARIEEYAFIADTHSAALVSTSGSMDWLCLPRFDSSAIFSAILDAERGGRWRIAPAVEITATRRRYRGETLILETVFETNEGAVTLVDCLALEEHSDPSIAQGAKPEEVVVRLIRGESGRVPMEMEWTPRFGYGDVMPWFRDRDSTVEAVGGAGRPRPRRDVPSGARARRCSVPVRRDGRRDRGGLLRLSPVTRRGAVGPEGGMRFPDRKDRVVLARVDFPVQLHRRVP